MLTYRNVIASFAYWIWLVGLQIQIRVFILLASSVFMHFSSNFLFKKMNTLTLKTTTNNYLLVWPHLFWHFSWPIWLNYSTLSFKLKENTKMSEPRTSPASLGFLMWKPELWDAHLIAMHSESQKSFLILYILMCMCKLCSCASSPAYVTDLWWSCCVLEHYCSAGK